MDELPIIRIPTPENVPDDVEDFIEDDGSPFLNSVADAPIEEPIVVLEVAEATKKPKKPLSDKQRAHLTKARAKAQEKAKIKRDMKNALEAKVLEELKKPERKIKKTSSVSNLLMALKVQVNRTDFLLVRFLLFN